MSINKHVDKKPGFLGIGGKTFIVTKEEYTMDGAATWVEVMWES